MKIRLLNIIFLLCTVQQIQAQDLWSVISTSDATSESNDVVIDQAGNTYITGYISGDTEMMTHQLDMSTGYSNAYVAKIDPKGKYLWVKMFGGKLADKGQQIALTPDGDLVVVGTFFGTIDFEGTVLKSTNDSKDIFMVKMNASGAVVWARKDGGALGDNPYGLAVDNTGAIIMTGQFEGKATIGNETFTSMNDPLSGIPSFDMFLAKFDQDGNPIWAKAAYAEYEDRGLSVACDANNNIFLSGQFSDTIDFFGGIINNEITNAGFVAKFNPQGTRVWFDRIASSQVLAYDLCVNSLGEVVVTGDFIGQLVVWHDETFDVLKNNYAKKIFVVKLSNNGGYIWGKAYGSESEVSSRSVCVDQSNNIYIGGQFKCNFDEFRAMKGTGYWQSAGFRDIYAAKLSKTGNLEWFHQMGGQKDDRCWGIAVAEKDYPILTGSYQLNATFANHASDDMMSKVSNSPEQRYDYDDIGYIFLEGDESINSITTKMLGRPNGIDYNYYRKNGNLTDHDSLTMYLLPKGDTIDFCPNKWLSAYTNTRNISGPLYDPIKWYLEGVQVIPYQTNDKDGNYSAYIQRLDQCYFWDDTVYVRYHPAPTFPILNDNFGVNVNTIDYKYVERCSPDTLKYWFSNFCAGCEVSKSEEFLTLLVADSVYQTNVSTWFTVYVKTEFDCVIQQDFEFRLLQDIKPYLILADQYDMNDSIMLCSNNKVHVIIADSITNPNGALKAHIEKVKSASVTVTHNGTLVVSSSDGYSSNFTTVGDGWYVMTQLLSIGKSPCIFNYTIVDSFYVEVKESPDVALLGGELLCPDEYNYLSIVPAFPDVTWYGPAILWTSDAKDSIKLNESGYYGVSGFYDYGEVKCSFTKTVKIEEKAAPNIVMDPVDGLICPGDSVHLSLSQTGSAYEWLGPQGFAISFDPSLYVDIQGFYSCIFTDNDGCQLLTPLAEVKEYITPFIDVSPSKVLCSGGEVELTALYGGNAVINWWSPLNSSADTVVVNQLGTYTCEVTQCGFTVRDSVTLIDGSFDVKLSYQDSILCYGDTILISVPSGLGSYEWSDGEGNQDFLKVTEEGEYSVSIWSNYGCLEHSDTLTIKRYPGSIPPAISDVTLCPNDDVTLIHKSDFELMWYTSADLLTPIHLGDTLFLPNVLADTAVFAAYKSTDCPLAYKKVILDVLEPLQPPVISGSQIACVNGTLELEVPEGPERLYRWVHNGDTVSFDRKLVFTDIFVGMNPVFEIYIRDKCSKANASISVEVREPSPFTIDITVDTLCLGEQLIVNATGAGNIDFVWTDGTTTWNGSTLDITSGDLSTNLIKVYGINQYTCHSDTLDIQLNLSTQVTFNIGTSGLECLGNSIEVFADTIGELNWTFPNGETASGDTIQINWLTKGYNGYFQVSYVDPLGCAFKDSILIEILPLPTFDLGADTVLCLKDVFELYLPNLPYTFVWNGGDTINSIIPNGTDPIMLTAMDSLGCVFSDTIMVSLVNCDGSGANVVTPNGDGVNEYFTIFNADVMPNNYVRIYNRWGNVMFEEQFYRNTYSPTELTDGVYFYEFYPDGLGGRKLMDYFHVIKH